MLKIKPKIIEVDGVRHSCLEYENDGKIIANNVDFYVLDLKNEELLDILSHTGGFCANIMKRDPENRNIVGLKKIMFACLPQINNKFCFYILYLDDEYRVLMHLYGDNFYDFNYFKEKFSFAIFESGYVYNLKKYGNIWNFIKKEISENSSKDFGVVINGKEVSPDDLIETNDFSVFNDEFKEMAKYLGCSKAIIKFKTTFLAGMQLSLIPTKENNDPMFLIDYDSYDSEQSQDQIIENISKNNPIVIEEKIKDLFSLFYFDIPIDILYEIDLSKCDIFKGNIDSIEEKSLIAIQNTLNRISL